MAAAAAKSARPPDSGRPKAAPKRPIGYAEWSMDPLHILLFVLPLVVFYELMLLFSDVSGVVDTVAAHEIINRAVGAFGEFGLYLPGILLVAALIVMKIARGDPWKVRPAVIPGMALESVAWAIPLLLIAALLSTTPAVQVSTGTTLADLPLQSRIALSIGAGLYEEMLFRLLLLSILAAALRHIFRISHTLAAGIAIGLAALAFTFYHQPTAGVVPLATRLVYFVAGCFLGLVYILRGFGIVVGAHAAYDLFVLVMIGSGDPVEGV